MTRKKINNVKLKLIILEAIEKKVYDIPEKNLLKMLPKIIPNLPDDIVKIFEENNLIIYEKTNAPLPPKTQSK